MAEREEDPPNPRPIEEAGAKPPEEAKAAPPRDSEAATPEPVAPPVHTTTSSRPEQTSGWPAESPRALPPQPPAEWRSETPRPEPRRRIGRLSAFLTLLFGALLGGTCVRSCGGVATEVVAGPGSATIGVVEVIGPIADGQAEVRRIRQLMREGSVDAILVRVDSPGGAVAPSQEIYEALVQAGHMKPVVASIGTVGASGGLWIALGAERIFASAGSITGSIGVITYGFDLRGIAERLAISPRVFKSGVQKDSGNPFGVTSPQEEQATMDLIADVYDQFVSTVAERRRMSVDHVRTFADGRVLSGRVAKELGLVDDLGGLFDAAREAAWLVEVRRAEEGGRPKPERDRATELDPTLVYERARASGLLRMLAEDAQGAASAAMMELARSLLESQTRVEVR
ncbi:MAG: signal peptide peptidase SppA [Deltaproteobacteria bacterium]|nr:signal peptide peptidase SppA [Deltaproteobacteria bacterium]